MEIVSRYQDANCRCLISFQTVLFMLVDIPGTRERKSQLQGRLEVLKHKRGLGEIDHPEPPGGRLAVAG